MEALSVTAEGNDAKGEDQEWTEESATAATAGGEGGEGGGGGATVQESEDEVNRELLFQKLVAAEENIKKFVLAGISYDGKSTVTGAEVISIWEGMIKDGTMPADIDV